MRIFITGASGWIGSAVIPELLGAGHQVLGLARSDRAAAVVEAAGAEVHRGDLDDLDRLRAGVAGCDGVVHLGYSHDFSQMAEAARMDLQAIETIGDALAGTDGPMVVASGILGLATGRTATEQDRAEPGSYARVAGADLTLSLAERGVRSSIVRFAPTVHGAGDHGFLAALVAIARATGVAGYVGDGANRWTAVHRRDAARLVALAVDGAPAGSVLHGVADEGVATRAIAEAIGRGLDVPVESVPAERAGDHFDWLARFYAADAPASSTLTRDLLGWQPAHPGLLGDLAEGHYFTATV